MTKIVEKSIYIRAPVRDVYDYINAPSNLPHFWPGMVEVSGIESVAPGRDRFNFVYKMAGVPLHGTSIQTHKVQDQTIVTHTEGGIESEIIWEFQPDNGSTNVKFKAAYTVPLPVLGKLAEALVVRQNEREADVLLTNLKEIMEHKPADA